MKSKDIQFGRIYKSKEINFYVIPLRKEERRLTGEIVHMGVEAFFPLAEFLFFYEICE